MRELKILPKFRDLCRPLTEAEKTELHVDINAHGVLSPIIVWEGKDIIVDGHNRYDICKQYNKPFAVTEILFSDEDEAIVFIVRNQLGRRNVSDEVRDYLMGQLHEAKKRQSTKYLAGVSGNPSGVVNNQECNCCTPASKDTATQIAAEQGVSRRTVLNNAELARAVDALGIREQVLSGTETRSRKAIIQEAKDRGLIGKAKPKAKATAQTPATAQPKFKDVVAKRWGQFIKGWKPNELKKVKEYVVDQLDKL